MTDVWESPRAIEVKVAAYRSKRFEDYMGLVDTGKMTQELALIALREEISYQDQFVEGA